MKKERMTLIIALIVALIVVFSGCSPEVPTYSVTYDGNGATAGSIEDDTQYFAKSVVRVLGPIGSERNLEKTGFTFKGWKDVTSTPRFITQVDTDGRLLYNEGSTFKMPSRNVTLTAIWEVPIDSYTVSFDANGGTAVAPVEVAVNGKVARPAVPTLADNTFVNWYDNVGLIEPAYNFNTEVTEAKTLYAKWSPIVPIVSYDVTFDSNGGSAVTAQSVVENAKATRPADPNLATNTFVNWYDNALLVEPAFNFNTLIGEDKTLYAKWSPIVPIVSYDVTFDSNGGSAVTAQSVVENAKATRPADPNLAANTFVNWYDNALLVEPAFNFNTLIGEDKTLYAKWSPIVPIVSYDVTFDSNGGSAVTAQSVVENAKATRPADPNLAANTFVNWYDNALLVEPAFNFNTLIGEDKTLYAKWSPIVPIVSYDVTFDSNGGSAVTAQSVVENAKATRPADPNLATNTFVNWYDNALLVEPAFNFNTLIGEDKTLYAKWSPIVPIVSYDVTFDSNGGSAVTAQSVVENAKATRPADPNLATNTFVNWYDNALLVEPAFNFNTLIGEDKTLYAKWSPIVPIVSYDVTFDSNGGSAVTAQSVVENAKATRPADPNLATNTFVNWYDNALLVEPAFNFNTLIGEDKTLYAKWSPIVPIVSYDVTFDSNGGSAVTAQSVVENAKATRPADPNLAANTFVNWYDNALLVEPAFNFNTLIGEDKTLYAKWSPIVPIVSYDVTFDSNGGSAVTAQSVVENAKATRPADPNLAANTFVNWYDNALLVEPAFNFNTLIGEDKTLFAKWAFENFAITYVGVDDADNSVNPESYTINDGVITLKKPSQPGYRFDGWYEELAYTTLVTTIDSVTAINPILYAKWQPMEFDMELRDVARVLKEIHVVLGEKYGIKSYLLEVGAEPLGKDFVGWYTTLDSDTGVLVDADTVVSVDNVNDIGNNFLYARWILERYDLTYILNGGANDAANPVDYTIEDAVTFADATRTGYLFGGWHDAAGPGGALVPPIVVGDNGDLTLHAYWSANPYNLIFDKNLGAGVKPAQSITFNTTDPLDKNTEISRFGHTFEGWSTTDTGVVEYVDQANYTMDTEGSTLYAVWTHGFYDVVFDNNDADGVELMGNLNFEFTTDKLLTTNTFTFTGHGFAGWATSEVRADAGTIDYLDEANYIMDSEGETLYAVWIADYDVTYHANGATLGAVPADQKKKHNGDDLILQLNTGALARPDSTFIGWNTAVDGSGTHYDVGDVYTLNGAETLYAEWEANIYALGSPVDNGAGNVNGVIANINNFCDYQNPADWKYLEVEDTDDYEKWVKASDRLSGVWKLPSMTELGTVYLNLHAVLGLGGFDDEPYWSDEEVVPPPANEAKAFSFADGSTVPFSKTVGLLRYRYVRYLSQDGTPIVKL